MSVLRNNKGFSLIELMVVVAIIAILATIAVPSYQGFQAKARQKEGFALLNAYYTSAQATYAELGFYPGNFVATGFAPAGMLGYRVTAENNAGSTPMYGSNDPTCTDTGMDCTCAGSPTQCPTFKTWVDLGNGSADVLGPTVPMSAMAVASTMNQAFTAVASGWVKSSAAQADEYTIDQLKDLQMAQDGLN